MVPEYLLLACCRHHFGAHPPHDGSNVDARVPNVLEERGREWAVTSFTVESNVVRATGRNIARILCTASALACGSVL
jgi:hypothetical protein